MLIRCLVIGMLSVGFFGAGIVSGQDYPSKPVHILTSEPGGSTDFTSRLIAQTLSGPLGQPVIVENRGGSFASGEAASKAAPDGYTLLVAGGSFTVEPLLRRSPYDPVRDFLPITLATRSPNILVVHPSLPVKSVKELIALAKAKPGELNYAAGSTGTSTHLAGELLKALAGIDIVSIFYKGSGPGFVDLLRGEVQLSFGGADRVIPLVKAGKLRALGVTSAEPSALAPGLPPIAASLPGYESISMQGAFAPAKTPATIINRLNQEIVRFLKTAEAKEKFLKGGMEAVGSSPEEYANQISSDTVRVSKLIKDAGIKAD